MACKGICIRYEAQTMSNSGRYATGQKRCQSCDVFIRWDGFRCPCCSHILRTKPRSPKYKARLQQLVALKQRFR